MINDFYHGQLQLIYDYFLNHIPIEENEEIYEHMPFNPPSNRYRGQIINLLKNERPYRFSFGESPKGGFEFFEKKDNVAIYIERNICNSDVHKLINVKDWD